jgi:hypothetical protein
MSIQYKLLAAILPVYHRISTHKQIQRLGVFKPTPSLKNQGMSSSAAESFKDPIGALEAVFLQMQSRDVYSLWIWV